MKAYLIFITKNLTESRLDNVGYKLLLTYELLNSGLRNLYHDDFSVKSSQRSTNTES